ncbi:MAG TPA: PD-(D/E)XK nuclease family protein, partial [Minicystis sp.]|nr:PD-(D/E)XK nuclease family protein [Minicystis sp.]
ERAFGPRQAPPWDALAIEGEPPVFVEGQIDRVDRTTDGRLARVVDYKTGSSKPSQDEHGRTRFQLAVYAAVVERALGAAAVEAEYVLVRPRGVVEQHPKKPELRAKLVEGRKAALENARRVVLAAWAGDGRPRPYDGATCARCEARDVCRRPAVMPETQDEPSA